MHSGDKIFQSIYSIYKTDGYCHQSRVICHSCKGNFDFTTKESLFFSVIFPPMSVCIHIKTHFKFIPVLHFHKEDSLSVSSCCSSVSKAPEFLFTSSANEYVETPSKPKESHLCKTGSNIAAIVFRSQMYTFAESQGSETFALNGCKRGHGNVCEILSLSFLLLFLTLLKQSMKIRMQQGLF